LPSPQRLVHPHHHPWVKRLNKFRIVPSLGNRFIPSSACKARSAFGAFLK